QGGGSRLVWRHPSLDIRLRLHLDVDAQFFFNVPQDAFAPKYGAQPRPENVEPFHHQPPQTAFLTFAMAMANRFRRFFREVKKAKRSKKAKKESFCYFCYFLPFCFLYSIPFSMPGPDRLKPPGVRESVPLSLRPEPASISIRPARRHPC